MLLVSRPKLTAGNPDRAEVEVPELVGPLDPEEARPATASRGPVPLQEALLAHHPLRPLVNTRRDR